VREAKKLLDYATRAGKDCIGSFRHFLSVCVFNAVHFHKSGSEGLPSPKDWVCCPPGREQAFAMLKEAVGSLPEQVKTAIESLVLPSGFTSLYQDMADLWWIVSVVLVVHVLRLNCLWFRLCALFRRTARITANHC
jgi:hypothetical protein